MISIVEPNFNNNIGSKKILFVVFLHSELRTVNIETALFSVQNITNTLGTKHHENIRRYMEVRSIINTLILLPCKVKSHVAKEKKILFY